MLTEWYCRLTDISATTWIFFPSNRRASRSSPIGRLNKEFLMTCAKGHQCRRNAAVQEIQDSSGLRGCPRDKDWGGSEEDKEQVSLLQHSGPATTGSFPALCSHWEGWRESGPAGGTGCRVVPAIEKQFQWWPTLTTENYYHILCPTKEWHMH